MSHEHVWLKNETDYDPTLDIYECIECDEKQQRASGVVHLTGEGVS